MDSSTDYFTVFELPAGFEIDKALLKTRYLSLQKQFHPDRVAGESAQQQRLAVQSAALVNQAYAVLSSPVQRAHYLLELAGLESGTEQTHTGIDFLTAQMELRENLAEVRQSQQPFDKLFELEAQVVQAFSTLEKEFAQAYEQGDLDGARVVLDKMQFYDKLRADIELLEDELDD
ncbi:MAG TPA: Fe-S protein assembly co-chaperone HscB [Porticoccaceae bacterium]|nr:Fe-S protein assembly co-chaperone HscB [Porticoccaceae bacterium]